MRNIIISFLIIIIIKSTLYSQNLSEEEKNKIDYILREAEPKAIEEIYINWETVSLFIKEIDKKISLNRKTLFFRRTAKGTLLPLKNAVPILIKSDGVMLLAKDSFIKGLYFIKDICGITNELELVTLEKDDKLYCIKEVLGKIKFIDKVPEKYKKKIEYRENILKYKRKLELLEKVKNRIARKKNVNLKYLDLAILSLSNKIEENRKKYISNIQKIPNLTITNQYLWNIIEIFIKKSSISDIQKIFLFSNNNIKLSQQKLVILEDFQERENFLILPESIINYLSKYIPLKTAESNFLALTDSFILLELKRTNSSLHVDKYIAFLTPGKKIKINLDSWNLRENYNKIILNLCKNDISISEKLTYNKQIKLKKELIRLKRLILLKDQLATNIEKIKRENKKEKQIKPKKNHKKFLNMAFKPIKIGISIFDYTSNIFEPQKEKLLEKQEKIEINKALSFSYIPLEFRKKKEYFLGMRPSWMPVKKKNILAGYETLPIFLKFEEASNKSTIKRIFGKNKDFSQYLTPYENIGWIVYHKIPEGDDEVEKDRIDLINPAAILNLGISPKPYMPRNPENDIDELGLQFKLNKDINFNIGLLPQPDVMDKEDEEGNPPAMQNMIQDAFRLNISLEITGPSFSIKKQRNEIKLGLD